MNRYRPKAYLNSRTAIGAVEKRYQRHRQESPRDRRMWGHWMNELDRLCPCKHRRKPCLQFRSSAVLNGQGRWVQWIKGLKASYTKEYRE